MDPFIRFSANMVTFFRADLFGTNDSNFYWTNIFKVILHFSKKILKKNVIRNVDRKQRSDVVLKSGLPKDIALLLALIPIFLT